MSSGGGLLVSIGEMCGSFMMLSICMKMIYWSDLSDVGGVWFGFTLFFHPLWSMEHQAKLLSDHLVRKRSFKYDQTKVQQNGGPHCLGNLTVVRLSVSERQTLALISCHFLSQRADSLSHETKAIAKESGRALALRSQIKEKVQKHTARNKLANPVNYPPLHLKREGSSSSINLSLPLSVSSWDTSRHSCSPSSVLINHIVSSLFPPHTAVVRCQKFPSLACPTGLVWGHLLPCPNIVFGWAIAGSAARE